MISCPPDGFGTACDDHRPFPSASVCGDHPKQGAASRKSAAIRSSWTVQVRLPSPDSPVTTAARNLSRAGRSFSGFLFSVSLVSLKRLRLACRWQNSRLIRPAFWLLPDLQGRLAIKTTDAESGTPELKRHLCS